MIISLSVLSHLLGGRGGELVGEGIFEKFGVFFEFCLLLRFF